MRLFVLKILMLVSTFSFGQNTFTSDFFEYTTENKASYRELGITECETYVFRYEDGQLIARTLSEIEHIDSNGLIQYVVSHTGNDTYFDTVFIDYSAVGKIASIEFYWYEDRTKEKATYEYNSRGQLIKVCEYLSNDNMGYLLDSCTTLHYNEEILMTILNEQQDTIAYFNQISDTLVGFDHTNKAFIKVLSDKLIMSRWLDYSTFYEYFNNGDLRSAVIVDTLGTAVTKILFEYNDFGLLWKQTHYYSNSNKIRYKQEYYYKLMSTKSKTH